MTRVMAKPTMMALANGGAAQIEITLGHMGAGPDHGAHTYRRDNTGHYRPVEDMVVAQ